MHAGESNKGKDSFLALPLKLQCDELGIEYDILNLQKKENSWVFADQAFKQPEPAAFAHFESLGFKGNFCEGSAPLMLMKSASLNYLSKANFFNDRSDACMRYFEAQCAILQSNSGRIVNEIRLATTDDIRRNFSEIRSKPLYLNLYPEISIEGLLAIWQSIGASGWAKIAEAFMFDPYKFRAGWPDLTIACGNSLRLVEIKTSDKLHVSQKETFSKLLTPLGLHVSVLKLTQQA